MRVILISVAVIVSLGVSVVIYWFMASNTNVVFGANQEPGPDKTQLIVYGYLMTLVGVFCGAACRELIALRGKGERGIPAFKAFFVEVGHSTDLWLGMFGSPLVFASVLRGFDGQNFAGLTVLALQSGFTCTMVIAALVMPQEKKERQGGPNANPPTSEIKGDVAEPEKKEKPGRADAGKLPRKSSGDSRKTG
jgi:hypothetical protein